MTTKYNKGLRNHANSLFTTTELSVTTVQLPGSFLTT